MPAPTPFSSVGFVAADPSQPGRFAILTTGGGSVQIYVTLDRGISWVDAVRLNGHPGAKYPFAVQRPWISYSPIGVLAVFWRSNYPGSPPAATGLPPGPQDVFAAVSFDGGSTFSEPLKLNARPGASPDPALFQSG